MSASTTYRYDTLAPTAVEGAAAAQIERVAFQPGQAVNLLEGCEQLGRIHRDPGGERAVGIEAAATPAVVVVGGHGGGSVGSRCQTMSGDSGITTEPSRCLIGPAELGLMSKSKICVGSHSVAQAFGTSTTPLMWPCTGAVPRMA